MKIGVYSNLTRDIGGRATKALCSCLKTKGVSVFISDELKGLNLSSAFSYHSRTDLAQQVDVMIVFGGDGTILRVARECAKYKAKIFAVNVGNRGFLTEIDNINIELENIIDTIISKNYVIDKRLFLEVLTKGNKFYALNEVVLARGSRTKTMKCEIRVNNALLDKYIADGVIISTPTGSTAYNISAGGPIIAPDVDALVITPISAHSLHSRPIVVNNNSSIWVELKHAEPHAHLNIDGEDVLNLADGDSFSVTKSSMFAEFIRFSNYNYYDKLLEKMLKWSSINLDL